jgi:hypothetical protein
MTPLTHALAFLCGLAAGLLGIALTLAVKYREDVRRP